MVSNRARGDSDWMLVDSGWKNFFFERVVRHWHRLTREWGSHRPGGVQDLWHVGTWSVVVWRGGVGPRDPRDLFQPE